MMPGVIGSQNIAPDPEPLTEQPGPAASPKAGPAPRAQADSAAMDWTARGTLSETAARVRTASSRDGSAATLGPLLADPEVTVRAALAVNPALPLPLAGELARDPDERVRALLARRLASLLPALAAPECTRLFDQAMDALIRLANDEVTRVRAAITEMVQDMAQAPRALILRLVADTEMSVAEPVIRLSPLLTADDLLALLATPPSPLTVTAIARRRGLDGEVADAVAASGDPAAILAMLRNPSAAIRESTLDSLVAQATQHVAWHRPLVQRPDLSARAARALSQFVSAQLLAELAQRGGLEPELVQELQARLKARLEEAHPQQAAARATPELTAMRVTEERLLDCARHGDVRACTALLAAAAKVPTPVVDRAAMLRSAKGLISLVWRAGLSMRVAVPLQMLLARLSPDMVLLPLEGDTFPLSAEEMRWQIDFLTRMGR
jgi:uncharacterized protein (DUF2336 family)